jgi:predicted nucleic acid-binding protein
MKIVLDTNVLISGIYFSGPPGTILQAWRSGYLDTPISGSKRQGDLSPTSLINPTNSKSHTMHLHLSTNHRRMT